MGDDAGLKTVDDAFMKLPNDVISVEISVVMGVSVVVKIETIVGTNLVVRGS